MIIRSYSLYLLSNQWFSNIKSPTLKNHNKLHLLAPWNRIHGHWTHPSRLTTNCTKRIPSEQNPVRHLAANFTLICYSCEYEAKRKEKQRIYCDTYFDTRWCQTKEWQHMNEKKICANVWHEIENSLHYHIESSQRRQKERKSKCGLFVCVFVRQLKLIPINYSLHRCPMLIQWI